MKTVTLNIYGEMILCKRFATRGAADRYMARNKERKLVYFRAHDYYVSIEK